MIDLHPAATRVAELLADLHDEELALPTPCAPASVGDLADHLGLFAANFAKVARKELDQPTSAPPRPFDGQLLEAGWRERIAAQLRALAEAWSPEAAWEGTTWVAGMDLPAQVVGVIALDELVLHGWDLSVATGRPYDVPLHEVEAVTPFVATFEAPRDGQLFGPIVDVDPTASPLERLLGLAGRDPAWRPAA